MTRARSLTFLILAVGSLTALAVIGFTPIESASRDEIFAIPKGTWVRRMSGNKVEILPDHIRLPLGIRDVLVLRIQDDEPSFFGRTLMVPGQTFRLPFERAAEYTFACTAHASGQMTIVVEPSPTTPWARLRWRLGEILSTFR